MTTTADIALITGASSGIGAATAQQLAAEGMTVVLAARSEDRLTKLAEEFNEAHGEGSGLAVPTDVTDPDAVDALVEATLDQFGRLDAAVVNAGIGEQRDTPVDELPLEQFEAVTETNVHGAYYTVRAALPALRESNGTLAFVGSYKGKYPSASTPIYAASKWWLRGFAASVAARAGPDGVGVTVVNPSGVPTQFGSEYRETTNDRALDPDETVRPDDVADALSYAIGQNPPAAAFEIDLYRRDIHERF